MVDIFEEPYLYSLSDSFNELMGGIQGDDEKSQIMAIPDQLKISERLYTKCNIPISHKGITFKNGCIGDILSLYPSATTVNSLVREIVGADDTLSMRKLISIVPSLYLPIRWNSFIPTSSGTMLRILLPVLSFDGQIEALMKLGDSKLILHSLANYIERGTDGLYKYRHNITESILSPNPPIIQYKSKGTPNPEPSSIREKITQAAIKYRYTPLIPRNNLEACIQALSLYDLTGLINSNNYVQALDYSLQYGRIDIIDYILPTFTASSSQATEILSLTSTYSSFQDSIRTNTLSVARLQIHKNSIGYLYSKGYLLLSPVMSAIVSDNPQIISTSGQIDIYTPSMKDIQLILMFDSISMFKYVTSKGKVSIHTLVPVLKYAQKDIRKYILSSKQDEIVIKTLLPNASPSDLDTILQVLTSIESNPQKNSNYLKNIGNKVSIIDSLSMAISHGYIEILDKYIGITDMDIALLSLASPSTYPGKDDTPISDRQRVLLETALLFEYKYSRGLDISGRDLVYTWFKPVRKESRTSSYIPNRYFLQEYLRAAVVRGNILLTHRILDISHLYTSPIFDRKELTLLIKEVHMMNEPLCNSLIKIINT